MPDHILVSELFGPTIQGEGALAGQTSLFIRTSGCDYRCSWCDSMHAVDPIQIKKTARRMTGNEIVHAITKLPCAKWVTFSGGDPVAWDLYDIVRQLKELGFMLAVESQGSQWRDWLHGCDLITVSPKPPSSGMRDRLDSAMLQKYYVRLGSRMVFKIVIFNDDDLAFAIKIRNWMTHVPMYLTAGTERGPTVRDEVLAFYRGEPVASQADIVLTKYRWLVETALTKPDLKDVTILPQLHVLLWGDALGR